MPRPCRDLRGHLMYELLTKIRELLESRSAIDFGVSSVEIDDAGESILLDWDGSQFALELTDITD